MNWRTVALAVWQVCFVANCQAPEPDTTADPTDAYARFSPDGTRVAFVRQSDPSMPTGVYVINADGSNERFLARARSPAWSPDGRRLVVRLESDLNIWEIDAETGEPVRLVREVGDIFGGIDWSPDGKWVTYNSSGYPNFGIGRVNVATAECKLMVPGEAYNARWSRDSRCVIYRWSGSRPGIYRADSVGGQVKPLLLDGPRVGFLYPAWFGDSLTCVYQYRAGGGWTRGMALADTCCSWRPFSLDGGIADYDPDGRRFVYCAGAQNEPPEGAVRLFIVSADGTGNRRLTGGP
ncbi:hypothetical protein FJY71_02355 [candidate division WOR-3 bacterium]|nr:hypothetical protein [candidate division WOR-3 bacterium]